MQKAADKQVIKQLIKTLSANQKIIFDYYLAAVDIEQEPFIDLFSNVTQGKDVFERGLILCIEESLSEISNLAGGLAGNINSVNNAINDKKNNTLSQEERNELSLTKEMIQKMFVNPLTKAAAEQAKN